MRINYSGKSNLDIHIGYLIVGSLKLKVFTQNYVAQPSKKIPTFSLSPYKQAWPISVWDLSRSLKKKPNRG